MYPQRCEVCRGEYPCLKDYCPGSSHYNVPQEPDNAIPGLAPLILFLMACGVVLILWANRMNGH